MCARNIGDQGWSAALPDAPPRCGPLIESEGTSMPSIRIIVAFATLVIAITPARAQEWPTRPVTMVVPFAAGGPLDVVGRLLASRLSQIFDRQVVVENVTGAGGTIGSNHVAKATPDGYQFLYSATSARTSLARRSTRNPSTMCD